MNPSLHFRVAAMTFWAAVLLLYAAIPQRSAAQATQQPIAATEAFDAPACSDADLGGLDIDFGVTTKHVPSPQRSNPEWKAIILDSSKAPNLQPPRVLEGFVSPQASDEKSSSQATAEVAEEDLPWNHYTHDYTFKVIPDPAYDGLLSSWTRFPGRTFSNTSNLSLPFFDVECFSLGGSVTGTGTAATCVVPAETCPDGTTGTTCQRFDMEVEWDSASLMDEKEGFQRDWGAVPEFVWPTVKDRVWVSGRWIFDCGHPGTPKGDPNNPNYVKFETEIHPPRALVTFRLNHTALDSFPFARTSAPNFPAPQSYLPVTGAPVDPATLPTGIPNSGPTNVPVTEADIFVSVNGGAANDTCAIVAVPCSNYGGHTGPIIPVNDRNYVFDIYPPMTNYGSRELNGTFSVSPPVADASLQWRVVDHSSELPLHACGSADGSGCVSVDPIICLLDASTPPPTQSETSCPAAPVRPTRLRAILPLAGTNTNYFAKSILVGWDDVPTPANSTKGIRTFQVRLHELTVNSNGAGCCSDADWRVFVNVGGQYRYISQVFDTDANNGKGISQFNGGSNVCHGDPLTENADGDCYQFDNTPWTVSVQDGTPIHVAVGGFVARNVEGSDSSISLCRYPSLTAGCDPPTNFDPRLNPFRDLAFDNDDRIGTYEFDLMAPDYSPPNSFQTTEFDCSVISTTGCSLQYTVDFTMQEVAAATAPSSAPLVIGLPNFTGGAGIYFTAATPMIPQTGDPNVEGFQYRFHRQGASLPVYATQPFPVHWTHVDLASGVHSAEVRVGSANSGDGPYDFQYSAESFGNLLEPRHTQTVVLDTTPPVTTFIQPTATQYGHSETLTLNYSVSDGAGSGVKSFTPMMDGQTSAQFGARLDSLQPIYLESMSLGTHTFSVASVDNVDNAGTNSVIFTITVTFDSLKGDVTNLQALGCIDSISQSLTAKISAAQNLYAKGQIQTAVNILAALIMEVQAQAGKHISSTCKDPSGRTFNPVQFLIGDAQYLQGILAGQLRANPILGSVVNSSNVGINGATVNLMSSSKTVAATAATDSAGFYYIADTSGLVSGWSYSILVTLPQGYKSSTPASRTFTWSGTSVVGNFSLN